MEIKKRVALLLLRCLEARDEKGREQATMNLNLWKLAGITYVLPMSLIALEFSVQRLYEGHL